MDARDACPSSACRRARMGRLAAPVARLGVLRVVAPLLFLAAMGLGLGDLVDKDQGERRRRRLPRVRHARA